ncbi:hypothetical protein BC89_33445 [Pseudomonas monteilii]|nr:hypothetical protein BC89_33445 [Pseudomonas monteilii]
MARLFEHEELRFEQILQLLFRIILVQIETKSINRCLEVLFIYIPMSMRNSSASTKPSLFQGFAAWRAVPCLKMNDYLQFISGFVIEFCNPMGNLFLDFLQNVLAVNAHLLLHGANGNDSALVAEE